eukprot:SAG31_NODE_44973_length_260_cov_1.273292_1_plen_58_part_01
MDLLNLIILAGQGYFDDAENDESEPVCEVRKSTESGNRCIENGNAVGGTSNSDSSHSG